MKKLLTILICIGAHTLVGAVLNVDFNVYTRSAESSSADRAHKDIVLLVLDRSGSMSDPAKEVGRPSETRDDVLKQMLKDRMTTIAKTRPGAEIYIFPFSGRIKGPYGPYSADDHAGVLRKIGLCSGQTLLYDTVARAVDFGEDLISKDPAVRVWMYVYTDGANLCTSKYWTEEYMAKSFWGGDEVRKRSVKVMYPGSDNATYERFARDYLGKIKGYAANGKMSLESGCWLGAGAPPPVIDNKRKDDYKLELKTDGSALKNPAAMPSQTLKADLLIPIPTRCEQDLARLNAVVELEIDGRKCRGQMSLKPGTSSARINLTPPLPTKAFRGRLSVVDLPDAWKDVSISPPDAVVVDFAAPGALSFVSLEPRESQVYVKVGDSVKFSAKAQEGASVNWKLDGRPAAADSFVHQFAQAGSHTATATASKSGFVDAVSTISIQAVDASVGISSRPEKPVTGESVVFSAKAGPKAESWSWSVDGHAVEGKSSTLDGYVFDKSGRHTVKARVFFGHGILGECELPVDVAVKPFVKIAEPYAGQEFDFGVPVRAIANVEGGFESIDWQVDGDASDIKSSAVDRKVGASRPVEFRSLKGGRHTLTAVVKGAAGELKSAPVPFSVKREDVWVRIDEPVSGASKEVGKDIAMKASVKGESVKEVKWTVTCRGKELFSAKKPVQGGVASCVFRPDVSLGNGSVLMIKAEDAGNAEVSSSVDVETSFFAALEIASAKVGGRDANGIQTGFGEQVALEASCSGGVDAARVEWVAEVAGREQTIGNGLKVNAPKVFPDNSSVVTAKYYARAKLPDGSTISSGKVTVFFACDDIAADIVLPKGADGVTRTQFGLKEQVNVELSVKNGEVKDVAWDFGDGTAAKGAVASHSYGKYGKYSISASAKCRRCGKSFSFATGEIDVRKIPPRAKFEIKEKSPYYTVGGKLHLESKTEGDVDDLIWTVDGKEMTEFRGKPDAVVALPGKPCEPVICLQAVGPDGTEPSSYSRDVRVRYGWWATVPAVVVLVLAIYFLFRLFTGNAPRKWSFYTWEGPAPRQIGGGFPEELGDAYINKGVELSGVRKWNYWTKKGRNRLGDMLMIDGDDGNVWTPFSEEEFEVRCANDGTPIVRAPEGKFDDGTAEVNITGESPYFLFRYIGLDYSDDISKGHDNIRVRVVTDGGSGLLGGLLFLVGLGLALYAFVGFCLGYAI